MRTIFGAEAARDGIGLIALLHCVRARAQMPEAEISDTDISDIFHLCRPDAR